jgi:hypothetical protein
MFNWKSFFSSPLGMALIGCTCIVALGVSFSQLSDDQLPEEFIDSSSNSLSGQMIEIGGVLRPRSDIDGMVGLAGTSQDSPDQSKSAKTSEDSEGRKSSYGTTPLIPPSESPIIQEIYNALKSNDEAAAERLNNPFAEIAPFDEASYFANPQKYLSSVEPARVWQSAQPGLDVPQLKRLGERSPSIVQGETVRLQVQTKIGAPVSYMSFDLGAFQNRLAAITVAADDQGIATAEFTGTPGTINNVRVIAASPMASGNSEFMVRVLPRRAE